MRYIIRTSLNEEKNQLTNQSNIKPKLIRISEVISSSLHRCIFYIPGGASTVAQCRTGATNREEAWKSWQVMLGRRATTVVVLRSQDEPGESDPSFGHTVLEKNKR